MSPRETAQAILAELRGLADRAGGMIGRGDPRAVEILGRINLIAEGLHQSAYTGLDSSGRFLAALHETIKRHENDYKDDKAPEKDGADAPPDREALQ
jgi:hypothetical protein